MQPIHTYSLKLPTLDLKELGRRACKVENQVLITVVVLAVIATLVLTVMTFRSPLRLPFKPWTWGIGLSTLFALLYASHHIFEDKVDDVVFVKNKDSTDYIKRITQKSINCYPQTLITLPDYRPTLSVLEPTFDIRPLWQDQLEQKPVNLKEVQAYKGEFRVVDSKKIALQLVKYHPWWKEGVSTFQDYARRSPEITVHTATDELPCPQLFKECRLTTKIKVNFNDQIPVTEERLKEGPNAYEVESINSRVDLLAIKLAQVEEPIDNDKLLEICFELYKACYLAKKEFGITGFTLNIDLREDYGLFKKEEDKESENRKKMGLAYLIYVAAQMCGIEEIVVWNISDTYSDMLKHILVFSNSYRTIIYQIHLLYLKSLK